MQLKPKQQTYLGSHGLPTCVGNPSHTHTHFAGGRWTRWEEEELRKSTREVELLNLQSCSCRLLYTQPSQGELFTWYGSIVPCSLYHYFLLLLLLLATATMLLLAAATICTSSLPPKFKWQAMAGQSASATTTTRKERQAWAWVII